MHHPTERITHTTVFVTPVVEHCLERTDDDDNDDDYDDDDDDHADDRGCFLYQQQAIFQCTASHKLLHISCSGCHGNK